MQISEQRKQSSGFYKFIGLLMFLVGLGIIAGTLGATLFFSVGHTASERANYILSHPQLLLIAIGVDAIPVLWGLFLMWYGAAHITGDVD